MNHLVEFNADDKLWLTLDDGSILKVQLERNRLQVKLWSIAALSLDVSITNRRSEKPESPAIAS